MKKTIYATLFLILTGSIFSCKENETPLFAEKRFIRIGYNIDELLPDNYYEIDYSFGYEPSEVVDKIIKVPVFFYGYDLTDNTDFALKVNNKKTTLPKDCYELKLIQSIRPNIGNIDSLEIKLIRKTNSLQEKHVIRIELVSNDNFTTVMNDYLYVDIYVDDIFGKPTWWNRAIEEAYLGKYSDTKLRDFIDCTGIIDFGMLEPDQKKYYALMFKRDLERNPRNDEDGKLMTVTVIG